MVKFFKKASRKAGLPPGTLMHIGEQKVDRVRISVFDYDDQVIKEGELASIDEGFIYKDRPTVTWINIDGLHDMEVIEKVGKAFGLHPLVLEDIVHTGQRPKLEDYEDYVFIIAKMLFYDEEENTIRFEQFSLVLGPNYVITFQERAGDVFDMVRERLRRGKGRIRKRPPDYLAYALLDAIVDHYFSVLEKIGERIELMEDELIDNPTPAIVQQIHQLKRELIFLRKSVWPLREVIGSLERDELKLIEEKTTLFFRDVYDHTIQVIETVETYRDMVAGMLDVYLSSVSNRMNQVMKVLTVIATIFIPLTFIAGVYGMNFQYMPELEWHWGYPLVMAVMLCIGVGMYIYFRVKNWF